MLSCESEQTPSNNILPRTCMHSLLALRRVSDTAGRQREFLVGTEIHLCCRCLPLFVVTICCYLLLFVAVC